jgi:hypothetical protein
LRAVIMSVSDRAHCATGLRNQFLSSIDRTASTQNRHE